MGGSTEEISVKILLSTVYLPYIYRVSTVYLTYLTKKDKGLSLDAIQTTENRISNYILLIDIAMEVRDSN